MGPISDIIDWLDRQAYDTATEFNSYALTPFFIHSTRRFWNQKTGLPKLWRLEAILAMVRSVQATDSRNQMTTDACYDGESKAALLPD
jgi:hypothetical protein